MKKVLISGVSSGLGLALAEKYLCEGWRVYGFSRRQCPLSHQNLSVRSIDLADFTNIPGGLFELMGKQENLDLVILNAGILGEIADMSETNVAGLKKTMDINMWSNKVILDWLFKHVEQIEQVVAISSGAAVNGSRGWNGYSLSKAALNMLVMLYAAERVKTHFCALAPGLVDTAMQDYLCVQQDTEKYPSLERIQGCRGTEAMPSGQELARRLPIIIEQMKSLKSGSFQDIRKL